MRNIGIETKYPAQDLVDPDDSRGELFAQEINTMVKEIEDSELAGTAKSLIAQNIGDQQVDFVQQYNLAKQV